MGNLISIAMRMTLVAMILLGFCFLVLIGLLSIIRELFTNERAKPSALPDDDAPRFQSMAPQMRLLQLERH